MKKQIAEVQKYFKEKLLAGDFTVVKATYHDMDVKIDGEFPFTLKMIGKGRGADIAYSFASKTFMKLPEFTPEEILRMGAHTSPMTKMKKADTKKRIQEQIKNLQEHLKYFE